MKKKQQMAEIIDFNKAKAKLKEKPITFELIQTEIVNKVKKKRKIEVIVRKKKTKSKEKAVLSNPLEKCAVSEQKDYFADTEFEEVKRKGKIIIRIKKKYRK